MEDQIKELREVIYKIKESVDRLEANWEFDRRDFSEFQNRLGHLEVEFKQLRDQILGLPKKTADKVSESVDDMKQEAQDLKEVIVNKRITTLNNKPGKPWWKLW